MHIDGDANNYEI